MFMTVLVPTNIHSALFLQGLQQAGSSGASGAELQRAGRQQGDTALAGVPAVMFNGFRMN